MNKSILPLVLALFICACHKPSQFGTAADNIHSIINTGIVKNKKIADLSVPDNVADNLVKNKNDVSISNDMTNIPKHKFDVVAENVPSRAFFLGLVENTDINLVIHPEVSGSISLNLKNVTLSQVLDMVRRVYGYGFEIESKSIRVMPSNLQTKTYKINYLNMQRGSTSDTSVSSSGLTGGGGSVSSDSDSENSGDTESSSGGGANSSVSTTSQTDFWSELYNTVSLIVGNEEGRRVAASPMAGLIMVRAFPNELLRVENFLNHAEESLNRQVIIEAKILEVELNDAYRAGINWGLIGHHLKASQLGGDLHGSTQDYSSLPFSISSNGSNPSSVDLGMIAPKYTGSGIANIASPFGGVLNLGLNYKRLAAFVEMLGSQGNVQVLSSPRVSTINNQKALIKVGNDEFFVTNVSTTTTSGTTTTTTPTVDFEPFFTGIALDVTPQIGENNLITLHVHPTVSTVSSQNINLDLGSLGNQTYPLAKSSIRESDTIVQAKNEQLVVIGGLMQDKMKEIVTGIPLLKDIPGIGTLFRQTQQTSLKSELVILLRPIIVGNSKWTAELEKSRRKFQELDVGFHIGGNTKLFGTMGEAR